MPALAQPMFLALLPIVAVAAWFIYRQRRRGGIVYSATSRVPSQTMTWRVLLSRILPVLFLAGLALAIVALARPRTVLSRTHRTTDAIAIEMVVDLSGSMEALDLSDPEEARSGKYKSRLDVVKEVFDAFIERRPDDLVGLITFGGYASTRTPLTLDHQAVRHILKGVEIPKPAVGRGGQVLDPDELQTAIGDALTTACARLRKAKAKSRIVVLLTDGVSNAGVIEPRQALKAATELGIKVYTIGVGSTGRAPVPTRDRFGQLSIGYADVELDEALLKEIADATDGKYYNARDAEGLDRAIRHIDELETTEIERDVYTHYREGFPWFLGPGIALIALATILNSLVTRRLL